MLERNVPPMMERNVPLTAEWNVPPETKPIFRIQNLVGGIWKHSEYQAVAKLGVQFKMVGFISC